jgi:uncharacterized protein (TIGR03066 family)
MNALRLMAAGLLVVGVVVGVRAEDKKADIDKAKLVGVWEVVKSDEGAPPAGTVIEFTKDGKLKVTHKNKEGKEEISEGTYNLDGGKLSVAVKHGDKEDKHSVTIKKLTDTEMSAENEKGLKAEFKKKK